MGLASPRADGCSVRWASAHRLGGRGRGRFGFPHFGRARRCVAVATLAACLGAGSPVAFAATTITVSSPAGTLGMVGGCTLRDALVLADQASNPALKPSAEPGGGRAAQGCSGDVTGVGSPYTWDRGLRQGRAIGVALRAGPAPGCCPSTSPSGRTENGGRPGSDRAGAPELGVAQMPHVLSEEASSLRVSMRLATPAQRDRTRAQDVQRLDETRLATRAARGRRYQCWGSALPSERRRNAVYQNPSRLISGRDSRMLGGQGACSLPGGNCCPSLVSPTADDPSRRAKSW